MNAYTPVDTSTNDAPGGGSRRESVTESSLSSVTERVIEIVEVNET